MKYRRYGNTDIQVSQIGMGGHREGYETREGLDRQARYFLSARSRADVVAAAIDAGVTYFDTTFDCEMISLGESLSLLGVRDGLFISGMRVDFFSLFLEYGKELYGNDIRKYTRRQVEGRLKDGKLDWLDQFLLGAMEQGDPASQQHRTAMEDAIYELIKLKESGEIRYFGFSCHDTSYSAKLIDQYPIFDSVMVPYNYGNRSAEEDLSARLEEHGVAWIVMKALVWEEYGIPVTALRLLDPVEGLLNHDPDTSIGRLSIDWILQQDRVSTTVPAMNSVEEVRENCYGSGAIGEEEVQRLDGYLEGMRSGNGVPLAVAGMLSTNLRVRGHGLGLAKKKLMYDLPPVNYEADNAEKQVAGQVKQVLNHLSQSREWADFLRKSAGRTAP